MELSALSDYELLEVLQYLTVDELLRCSGVCRRWQTLALDPSIWRTKSLGVSDHSSSSGTPLVERARSVLRLAPCLRELEVSADSVYSDVWDLAFGTTRCAAMELTVYFHMEKSHFVALMLARQASLGRLKRVSLETLRQEYHPSLDMLELGDNHGLGALMDQIVGTSGLEALSLTLRFPSKATITARCQAEVPAASLRVFEFEVIYNPYLKMHLGHAPHVQVLLEGHASTLEVVYINDGVGDEHYAASLPTSMPRLRELGCGVERVVDLAVPYPLLKTLHLDLWAPKLALGSHRMASWRRAYRKAGTYLRTAVTYLDELKIYLCPEGALFNLAYCFGASPAALSRLILSIDVVEVHPRQLRHLAGVLPQLPHLTHLTLRDVPTDALLDAMDGPAVPELLVLSVVIYEGCARAWTRSEKVRRVMCSHPRLHIVLEIYWGEEDDSEDCCTYCRKHYEKMWLCFTHPKGSDCYVVNHDDHHQIFIPLPSLEV